MAKYRKDSIQKRAVGTRLKQNFAWLGLLLLGTCFVVAVSTEMPSKKPSTPPTPIDLTTIEVPKIFQSLRPSQSPPPFPSAFLEAKEKLMPFKDDEKLGEAVKRLLTLLPVYEEEVKAAIRYSDGLTIDLILQDHGSDIGLDPNGLNPVYRSQARIYKLLKEKGWGVVAVEGFDLPHITIATVVAAITEEFQKNGQTLTLEEATQMVINDFPKTGVMRYLHEQSDVFVFGAEFQPLNRVHHIVVEELERAMVQPNQGLRFLAINDGLSHLRSEVAVAKTIHQLHRSQKKRAAIIIGYAHQKDVVEILRSLNVRCDVYNTLD